MRVVRFITMVTMLASLSSSLGSLRDQIAPADQVVGRGAEGKDPVDQSSAAVSQFAEQPDRLHPPEGLLDEFALPLTQRVAGVSGRAPIDGTAAAARRRLGDVRRNAHATDRRDPGGR